MTHPSPGEMYYMQLEDERRRQHAAAQEAAWWASLSQEERDSVVRERAEAEVARAHAVADRTKAEAAAERAMIDGRREAVRYLTEGITALRLADAPHAVLVRDRNAGGLRKPLMNAWLLGTVTILYSDHVSQTNPLLLREDLTWVMTHESPMHPDQKSRVWVSLFGTLGGELEQAKHFSNLTHDFPAYVERMARLIALCGATVTPVSHPAA